jgi:hypothetical protein
MNPLIKETKAYRKLQDNCISVVNMDVETPTPTPHLRKGRKVPFFQGRDAGDRWGVVISLLSDTFRKILTLNNIFQKFFQTLLFPCTGPF